MIDHAVVGYAPFGDVRLVAFPEFAHAAPVYLTVEELRDKLAVELPNEQTDRYVAKAKERNVYIQTGTFLEVDRKYPGCVFNTTCLIGPDGLRYKYRKVHPWIPWEVHASPHDMPGYSEPMFPVAETEIGVIGCAICYDWLFPEAIRELAVQGAEVLVRVSAYMDPWGATPPMDWWTVVNRCRALENIAYVVAANQGASLSALPAVLLAGRQHGRRLRRPHPRPGRPRPGREDRGRPDRHRGAPRRARPANRPPHARPTAAARRTPPSADRPTPAAAPAKGPISIEGNEKAIREGKERWKGS